MQGAHLICFPGAFNMSTGEALWELEQRARQVHPSHLGKNINEAKFVET